MDRMKKFGKYALWIILLYIFSTILTNAFFKTTFNDIKDYKIEVEKPYIEVTEAKSSSRNGHIYGIIKNNTENKIENKYIKASMLSKSGVVLGEKYVKIDSIDVNKLRKFEISFDYDNVKSFKIEIVDNKPEEQDFIELIKDNVVDIYNQHKPSI